VYLVLIDFGKSSLHALGYAACLAKESGKEIMLCHQLNIDDSPDEELDPIIEKKRKSEATEELKRISHFANPGNDLIFHYQVYMDLTDESFLQLIAEYNISIVFAGISTENKIRKWLFGSHVIDLINICFTPVLIVPEVSKLLRPGKMIFMIDNYEQSAIALKKIGDAGIAPEQQPHFIKAIGEKDEVIDEMNYHTRKATSKPEATFKAIEEFSPDAVCICVDEENNDKADSEVESVVMKSKIPVLVLHLNCD
jgi:hypothetical protein